MNRFTACRARRSAAEVAAITLARPTKPKRGDAEGTGPLVDAPSRGEKTRVASAINAIHSISGTSFPIHLVHGGDHPDDAAGSVSMCLPAFGFG